MKERGQALIFFLLLVILTVYLCIGSYSQFQLARRVAISTGKIVELHPENHNDSVYEYYVLGRVYRGEEAGTADQGFRSNFSVYYDPLNPGESSTVNPRRSADVMLMFTPFTAVMSLLLGILVYCNGEKVRNWFKTFRAGFRSKKTER